MSIVAGNSLTCSGQGAEGECFSSYVKTTAHSYAIGLPHNEGKFAVRTPKRVRWHILKLSGASKLLGVLNCRIFIRNSFRGDTHTTHTSFILMFIHQVLHKYFTSPRASPSHHPCFPGSHFFSLTHLSAPENVEVSE